MKSPLLLIATAAGATTVGVVIGYKVAENRLGKQFDERLAKETAGMREFYQAAKKPFATPQEAAAELIKEEPEGESTAEVINNKVAYHKIAKQYKPEEDPEETVGIDDEVFSAPDGTLMVPEVQHHNLFREEPHIISQDEYMQNDSGYIQSSLTYYEADKVLTDEREDMLEDQEGVVGVKNLELFGNPTKSLSSDENTIHIRNGRLQMEFEVCRSPGSYRREVLGMEEDPPQRPSGRPN